MRDFFICAIMTCFKIYKLTICYFSVLLSHNYSKDLNMNDMLTGLDPNDIMSQEMVSMVLSIAFGHSGAIDDYDASAALKDIAAVYRVQPAFAGKLAQQLVDMNVGNSSDVVIKTAFLCNVITGRVFDKFKRQVTPAEFDRFCRLKKRAESLLQSGLGVALRATTQKRRQR